MFLKLLNLLWELLRREWLSFNQVRTLGLESLKTTHLYLCDWIIIIMMLLLFNGFSIFKNNWNNIFITHKLTDRFLYSKSQWSCKQLNPTSNRNPDSAHLVLFKRAIINCYRSLTHPLKLCPDIPGEQSDSMSWPIVTPEANRFDLYFSRAPSLVPPVCPMRPPPRGCHAR